MINLFLRGPIQVGKSTLLKKVLEVLARDYQYQPAGFITQKGLGDDPGLYLFSHGATAVFDEEHCVAKRIPGCSKGFPHVFDQLGVSLIRQASKTGNLLVFDELGFFEQEALQFRREVLSCLNGDLPVIGVLKNREIPWYEEVLKVPNTIVFDVSLKNRDQLQSLMIKSLLEHKNPITL